MSKSVLGRLAAIIGLVLIIGSMLLSTVAPNLRFGRDDAQPAATAIPDSSALPAVIFPTPPPGTPVVSTAGIYVHPSATFYVLHPQGWSASPTTLTDVFNVSLVNPTLYSVVQAYIEKFDFHQDISSLDALNNADALAASWVAYNGWQETDRQALADRLVIDFTLELGGNTYLARHISWPAPEDRTWAMVLRLVVPGNNPALLNRLADLIIPSFHVLPDSLAVPLEWSGYIDPESGFSFRYPTGWQVVDGGPGHTATLSESSGQATLTLDSQAATSVADADAAAEWVRQSRPGAEVLDVAPVERTTGQGYQVAYTFQDADGEGRSGLAVLINSSSGRLLTATLRLSAAGINLLDAEAGADWSEAIQALTTFAPLPEDVLAASTITGGS